MKSATAFAKPAITVEPTTDTSDTQALSDLSVKRCTEAVASPPHARARALDLSLPSISRDKTSQNPAGTSTDPSENVVQLPFVERRREAKKAAILKALRTGLPIGAICTTLEIGRSTVHLWRKNDPAWDRDFEDAQIEGLEVLEGLIIIEHGARDWRALVRVLEARDPVKWNHRRCGACQARELREREAERLARLT